MNRPTRDTPAGRAYLDLQKQAKNDRRPTDELLQLYALEGLLDRLARSGHAERFVLKGGVLLAAFGQRRPTRDIDLHADALSNETQAIRRVICEIADIGVNDGLVFHTGSSSAEVIRDEEPYAGVRVLSRHLPVDATELTASIRRVATHRQVELQPLAQVLEGHDEIGQRGWAAWRRRQRLEDQIPAGFRVVVEAVVAFGEPVIAGVAKGFVWDPKTGIWS